MRPEPGDKVTIRYTFTLPETEPADGFKLPPTPLDQVNTVVVRQRDAATRDDKPGTVRRMRDSGVLVVKRRSNDSFYPWVSLDLSATGVGAFSDETVCGHSDYVGGVPGSEAVEEASIRVWLDGDQQYWFELKPGKLTWGGNHRTLREALIRAKERHATSQGAFSQGALTDRDVSGVSAEWGGGWIAETVTSP